MKQIVIISKKWNHPKISIIITDEELSFAIDLDQFIEAIKIEMAIEKKNDALEKAVDIVIKEIKGESLRIMA